MTSTNPTVQEQLVLDIDSVHSLAAVGLVEVSDGEPDGSPLALRTVPADAVVTEWLNYTHDLEADRATLDETRAELAESRAAYGRELETSLDLKTRLAAQSLQLAAARAIPAHTQTFIDAVREHLGSTPLEHLRGHIGVVLDVLDKAMRGAR